jgi:hypothetical protein
MHGRRTVDEEKSLTTGFIGSGIEKKEKNVK